MLSERRAQQLILFSIVVGAVALRCAGLGGDLWLDEIWALTLSEKVSGWSDVILSLHRDNNHHLTTVWMWLFGPDREAFVYRLLSFGFSLLSLWGVFRLAGAWLRFAGAPWFRILVLYLFGGSFLLVLYGTEARGYGGLVAAIIWSLNIAVRSEWRGRDALAFVFWCAVGLLSHPTFVFFLAPLVVTTWCRPVSSGRTAARCNLALLAALLVAGLLFHLDWRHIPPGTGTQYGYLEVCIDALNSLVGLPPLTVANPAVSSALLVSSLLVLALLARGVVEVYRADRLEGAFLGVVLFAVPLGIMGLIAPRVFFLRYLLFAAPPALYLLAFVVFGALRRGGLARGAALVVLLLFTLANGYHLAKLVTVGRGQYRDVATYISQRSPSGIVRYESDHPFRTAMVWDYYLPRMGLSPHFERDIDSCPEWYLTHTQDWLSMPPTSLSLPCGDDYHLVHTTETVPYSGWRWFVYRKRAL